MFLSQGKQHQVLLLLIKMEIAPDGTIAHTWAKVKTKGHAIAVLNRLRELATKA
jgi:peroxiredoxin